MMTTDYTGTLLDDKFEVIRLLGEGGMGAVYLARNKTINKPVAVKFLHAALADREEVVKRFYREAQAAAAIRHNNIIDVMDLGLSPKGEPYIVMEYLEGEGLAGRIDQRGPLSLPAACGIIEAALLALDAAHAKGIVHRDLKPDNIFLVRRRGELPGIKLIDFGISKFVALSDQTKITQDGSMLGTPAYMSPEQARGLENVDHRTDIYAMGVILYEVLTGEVPFKGSTYSELLLNMLTTEPRDPASIHTDFPEAARPVLEKALKKNPAERYQSAAEMLEAVRQLSSLEERMRDLSELAVYLELRSAAKNDDGAPMENSDTQLSDELFDEMVRRRSPARSTPGGAVSIIASAKRTLTVIVQNGEAVIHTLKKRGVFEKIKRPFILFMEKTKGKPKIRLGAFTLSGLLFTVFLFALCSEGDVRISVNGAPSTAKIFFNDVEMNQNPFDAAFSEDPVPLRVETEGSHNFEISIIPSRDQTIEVHFSDLNSGTKRHSAKKNESRESSAKKSQEPPPEAAADPDADTSADPKSEATEDAPKKRRPRFTWPLRRKKDSSK